MVYHIADWADGTMASLNARRYRMPVFGLLLLLFASQMTARGSFAWFCEGRICGTSSLYCCCDSPDSAPRDPQCASGRRTDQRRSAGEKALCSAGCNCERVAIGSAERPVANITTATPTPAPLIGVLIEPSRLPAPVLIRVTSPVPCIAVRGPPVIAACFPAHSLRAPPLA